MKFHNIYKSIVIISLLFSSSIFAQENEITSRVYLWNNGIVDNKPTHQDEIMLEGSSNLFEHLQVYSEVVKAGETANFDKIDSSNEILILMKEGKVSFKVNADEKNIGSGSLVLIYPNEEFSAKNIGEIEAVFYVLQYKTRQPLNVDSEGNNSFIVDWNDLEFKPHDKGGIRNYFEKSTAMLNRFEMHVTTLNTNINSHDAHTHEAEEIVLMIAGDANLHIGDSYYDAEAGDLIYLCSNVPHSLTNTGTENCMYFAFQWE